MGTAERMYRETGCDLVTLARASCGSPWVFEEIKHYLKTGEKLPGPGLETRMEIMIKHVDKIIYYKGERQGVREARKNVAWYLKGVRGAAALRNRSGSIESRDDVLKIIDEVLG